MGEQPGPGERAPESIDTARFRRAVDVFRIAAIGYAVVLHAIAQDEYRRPWFAWAVLGACALWTLFLSVHRARTTPLLLADLTIACAAILATRLTDDPERIAAGAQTLPSIWPAAAVLAWAVHRGRRGGIGAALAVTVADLVEVGGTITPQTVNNIVLLLLTGGIVGHGVQLVRQGRAEMAAAVAVRAANAERERLARDIHDSVLQVLGFVQRRGRQLGGEAADLARMAGEQEERLRGLVSTGPPRAEDGEADLRAALAGHASPAVTVSGPAGAVPLPAAVVAALEAATAAALDNVARHAGDGARAWVLVEDEGNVVTVTVRDDGAGFAPGRLESAAGEGRLGVSASIRGRIAEIGGTAEVSGAPGRGTEVELRVPRP